jgi:hypothetical protein
MTTPPTPQAERHLLRIIRPPGAGASMTIDGTECKVVRIKVHGDLIEVLYEPAAASGAATGTQAKERDR